MWVVNEIDFPQLMMFNGIRMQWFENVTDHLQFILRQFSLIVELRIAVFTTHPGCREIFIDFKITWTTGSFLMCHWGLMTIVFTNFKSIKRKFIFPCNNFLSSPSKLSGFFFLQIFWNFLNFKLLYFMHILGGIKSCEQIWSELSFIDGNSKLFFRLIYVQCLLVMLGFRLWSRHQVWFTFLWWFLNESAVLIVIGA